MKLIIVINIVWANNIIIKFGLRRCSGLQALYCNIIKDHNELS